MSTQKKKKKTTVEWNYMFPPYIVLFALMSKIIMFWFDNSFYSYKSYDYISNLI
jgi:ABC-type sugar transport system permease subunit